MQDKSIFVSVAVIAVVIGVLVFFSGSGTFSNTPSSFADSTAASAVAVPFTKIVQGMKSSVLTRANYLITSPTQLSDLWKMIDATGTPPTVDFKTHAVIAVFAGKESTSSIAVAKIQDTDARMVSITITRPDSTCTQKASTTSPYEIIVVPTTSLSLTHEDVSTTSNCKN